MPLNFERFDDKVLVSGLAGDYLFLSNDEFDSFVNHRLKKTDQIYLSLKSKQLIADSPEELVRNINMTSTRYRTRKGFLKNFTTLHMMVITVRCNQHCRYCQASCEDEIARQFDMKPETAKKIVDFIFKSPSQNIKIEFQGGEPLLNWQTIVETVLYAEALNKKVKKNLEFVVCTNITTDISDKIEFLKNHNISISSSLDGPQDVHDHCRLYKNETGTYQAFIKNLEYCRRMCGIDSVGALMTTTRYSLDKITSIIDEYITRGFNGIFLRAINPYGFAEQNKKELGYNTEDFVQMYKKALEYIIQLNKKGTFFIEFYTALLLKRILTHFPTGFVDLQSPAGTGICGVIYDYNGDIYPADEGRMLAKMGDKHFCLGNIHTNSYLEVFGSTSLRNIVSSSCLEIMPHCSSCVFQPYCGADPVRNYLETGDIMGDRLHSSFCKKNKGIFRHLFNILSTADDTTLDILWSWVIGKPYSKGDCYNEKN
jgi:His-Xaa-Ser system radical SAM maturase HxsB